MSGELRCFGMANSSCSTCDAHLYHDFSNEVYLFVHNEAYWYRVEI